MFRLDQLPPLPDGALGWKVYSGFADNPSFIGFVPDEEAVSAAGRRMADDAEAFVAGAG